MKRSSNDILETFKCLTIILALIIIILFLVFLIHLVK